MSLIHSCQEVFRSLTNQPEMDCKSEIATIRQWFQFDNDESAVMLAFIIANHKNEMSRMDIHSIVSLLPVSNEWKYRLLVGAGKLLDQGILVPDIGEYYSSEKYYLRVSAEAKKVILTQCAYSESNVSVRNALSCLLRFFRRIYGYRAGLFLEGEAFNLESELQEIIAVLDSDGRNGLRQLSSENQIIAICLVVLKVSFCRYVSLNVLVFLVVSSEEKRAELVLDIMMERNFLVANGYFYIEEYEEGYDAILGNNFTRLKQLVLGSESDSFSEYPPIFNPYKIELSMEISDLYFSHEINQRIRDIVSILKEASPGYLSHAKPKADLTTLKVFLCGNKGMGKSALVKQIAKETGRDIYRYDFSTMLLHILSSGNPRDFIQDFGSFLKFQNCYETKSPILVLDNFIEPEKLMEQKDYSYSSLFFISERLYHWLAERYGVVFVLSNHELSPSSIFYSFMDSIIKLPYSTVESRRAFWNILIPDLDGPVLDNLSLLDMNFNQIQVEVRKMQRLKALGLDYDIPQLILQSTDIFEFSDCRDPRRNCFPGPGKVYLRRLNFHPTENSNSSFDFNSETINSFPHNESGTLSDSSFDPF